MIGKETGDLRLERDGIQVQEEEGDPHNTVDDAEEEAAVATAEESGRQERHAKEEEQRADDRDAHGDANGIRAQLHLLTGRLDVRRPDQGLHAEMELLPQTGQTAQQRQLPEPVRVDDRAEALAQHLDLAIGLADGDGVRGPAAHHDAFEHGLAAVEKLVLAHAALILVC